MLKKILSLVLTLMMLTTSLPIDALAFTLDSDATTTVKEVVVSIDEGKDEEELESVEDATSQANVQVKVDGTYTTIGSVETTYRSSSSSYWYVVPSAVSGILSGASGSLNGLNTSSISAAGSYGLQKNNNNNRWYRSDKGTISVVQYSAQEFFTVTLKSNTDDQLKKLTYAVGSSFTPGNFTAKSSDGAKFLGWYRSGDESQTVVTGNITSTAVLIAKFESPVTASFTDPYTNEVIPSQPVVKGGTAAMPEGYQPGVSPTVENAAGYASIFSGWTPSLSDPIAVDTAYTAQYADYCTVTFMDNGVVAGTSTVAKGAPASTPDGYVADEKPLNVTEQKIFIGWTDAQDGESFADLSAINASRTVYAKYGPLVERIVNFVDRGVTVKTQSVPYGGAATAPDGYVSGQPVKPNDTVLFLKWDKDYSYVTSNMTVTAQFTGRTNNVYFYANGNQLKSVTVPYGEGVAQGDIPVAGTDFEIPAGKEFIGWDKALTDITETTIVTAQFSDKEYTVTFLDSNGDVMSTGTRLYDESYNMPSSRVVGVIPVGKSLVFDSWTPGGNYTTNDLLHVHEDMTFTAAYRNYVLVTFYDQYRTSAMPDAYVNIRVRINGSVTAPKTENNTNYVIGPAIWDGTLTGTPTRTVNGSSYYFIGWSNVLYNLNSDIVIHALYTTYPGDQPTGSQLVQYFIRYDNIIPDEPSNDYSSSAYTSVGAGYADVTGVTTAGSTWVIGYSNVLQRIKSAPKYAGMSDDMYVEWYVLKRHSNGYHIDGVLRYKNTYKVVYHTGSGSGVFDTNLYHKDDEVAVSGTTPTWSGYTFQGWALEENGAVVYQPNDKFVIVDHDVHLYAIWTSNTTTTMDVTVYKYWYPTSTATATLKLMRRDRSAVVDTSFSQTCTITGDGSHTFTKLPIYKDAAKTENWNYYVVEENVPDGYKAVVSGLVARNIKQGTLHVTKSWQHPDGTAYPGYNGTVNVVVKGTSANLYNTVTFTGTVDANGLSITVPLYDNSGNAYTYSVTEAESPDYTLVSNTGSGMSFALVNKLKQEYRDIDVTKVWNDDDNNDGVRPSSLNYQLSYTLDGATKTKSGWTTKADYSYTFTNVPLYTLVNGDYAKITDYAVTELNLPDAYEIESVTGSADTGFVVTNKHEPQTIDVTVRKVWEDQSNAHSTRPVGIVVELYAGGEATGKTVPNSGWTVSGNAWSYTFEGLQKKSDGKDIAYTIVETPVTGYADPEYTTDGATLVVTNTLAVRNVSVKKVWDDQNDQYELRPTNITVKLMNGDDEAGTVPNDGWNKTAANEWTYTFEGVPADGSYSLAEAVITGYTPEYSTVDGVLTVTNTLTTQNVTVTKVWDDQSDKYGLRPTGIIVTLKNGADTVAATTAETVWTKSQDGDSWTYTFEGVPASEDYVIEETQVAGYKAPAYTTVDGALTVTNALETVGLTGRKIWRDDEAEHDTSKIELTLTATYANVEGSFPVNATPAWTGDTFAYTGLPMYGIFNGEARLASYAATETRLDGYLAPVPGTDGDTPTITNIKSAEHTVEKVWHDDGARATVDARTATMQLQQSTDGGENWANVEGKTVTLPEADGTPWAYTWTDLPAFTDADAPAAILYRAVETAMTEGYAHDANADVTANGVTTITNTKIGDITVTKRWSDNENILRMRSLKTGLGNTGSDVYVALYQGQTRVGQQKLDSTEDKTYTFENVALFDAEGNALTFTAMETLEGVATPAVPFGYEQSTATEDGALVITNAYADNFYGDYTATKTWSDLDNRDGNRPDDVTAFLQWQLNNGEWANVPANIGVTVTADVPATDGVFGEWKNLPLYYDGQQVTGYGVKEAANANLTSLGYETSYTYDTETNVATGSTAVTILNAREQTELTGSKTWYDATPNTTHVNADEVTVNVFKGDSETPLSYSDTLTIEWGEGDKANQYTVKGLFKTENGQPIQYRVTETLKGAAEGKYQPSYNGNDITNTEIGDVEITKTWLDDGEDRPEALALTLNVASFGGAAAPITGREPDAVTAAGNVWTYTYRDMAKADANGALTYTATETDVPAGYKVIHNDTDSITNIQLKRFAGTKTFDMGTNASFIGANAYYPDSITVQLTNDAGDEANYPTLTQIVAVDKTTGTAAYSFPKDAASANDGLPTYTDAGKLITYTVTETAVTYGETTVTPSEAGFAATTGENGLDVTNALDIKDIQLQKTWRMNPMGSPDPDTTSVTVDVYDNSDPAKLVLVDYKPAWVKSGATTPVWTATISGLPKMNPLTGAEIFYTVVENSVEGFQTHDVQQDETDRNFYRLTNVQLTSVEATKTWLDGNDALLMRPETLQVTLHAADGTPGLEPLTEEDATITKDGNVWTYRWDNLPIQDEDGTSYVYYVTEGEITSTRDGYYYQDVSEYRLGRTLELVNKLMAPDIEVKKYWEAPADVVADATPEILLRPSVDAEDVKPTEVSDDKLTYTFRNLPACTEIAGSQETGTTITYTAVEPSVTVGENELTVTNGKSETFEWNGANCYFLVTVGGIVDNKQTVTNRLVRDLSGAKTWVDGNAEHVNADEITLTLKVSYAGQTGDPQTVTATPNWVGNTFTYVGLPTVDENGNAATYTVEEAPVQGYLNHTDRNDPWNLLNVKDTAHAVVKTWVGGSDAETRTAAMQLQQKVDGGDWTDVDGAAVTLTGGEQPTAWRYAWTNLPAYTDEGDAIQYRAVETATPKGYAHDADADVTENGVTAITNTLVTKSLSLTKRWYVAADTTLPETLTVDVYDDSLPAKLVLDDYAPAWTKDGDTWTATISDLRMYHEGTETEIAYAVEENVPGGFQRLGEARVAFVNNAAALANTNEYDVTAEKTWLDGGNAAGLRPTTGLAIELWRAVAGGTAAGERVDTATMTAPQAGGNTWTHVFQNQPYADGEGNAYNYYVVETVPANYEEISEDKQDLLLTNRLLVSAIAVDKVWDDDDDRDGLRPKATEENPNPTIEVTLTGTITGSEDPVVTRKADMSVADGKVTFVNVPRYDEADNYITYTATDSVTGYVASAESNADNTAITITNKHTPGVTTVPVKKIWADQDNLYGTRPQDIAVQLLANGQPVEGKTVPATGWDKTAANEWTYTFTDLPQKADGEDIAYTVQEARATGYLAPEYGKDATGVLTVTNSLDTTSVTATKTWLDGAETAGRAKPAIVVYTMNGTVATALNPQPTTGITWTENFGGASNVWQVKVDNLPKLDAQGNEITYAIGEAATGVPGYLYDGKLGAFTNTLLTDVNVTKTWVDDNADRPASVTVELMNGAETVATSMNDGWTKNGNAWTYAFTGVPAYDASNNKITYAAHETHIGETPVANGIAGAYHVSEDGLAVTNTKHADVSFTKHWVDGKDEHPEVELTLYAQYGDSAEKTATEYQPAWNMDDAQNWIATYADLPVARLVSGAVETIAYSIGEAELTGYASALSTDGKTLTNTKQVSFTVSKTWTDDNAVGGNAAHPASVTVQLMQGETPYGSPVTLSASETPANDWTHTWTNLPQYPDGSKDAYKYTVVETAPAGYTASYTNTEPDADGNYSVTVTNTRDLVTFTVNKVWTDTGYAAYRPDAVTVQLMSGETPIGDPVELSAATTPAWAHTWDKLPKTDPATGEAISYRVEETHVGANAVVENRAGDYDVAQGAASADANGDWTQTVTNAFSTSNEYTTTKVWRDGAETHPNITLQLQHSADNGQSWQDAEVPGALVELTGNNSPTRAYLWSKLPTQNKTGAALIYKAVETMIGTTAVVNGAAEGYAVTYSEDLATVYNTLYIAQNGTKAWVDAPDAAHSATATPITLTLSRSWTDAEGEHSETLTEAVPTWNAAMTEYTFAGLRASTDGNAPYTYSVKETGVPEGYLDHTDPATPWDLLNVKDTAHTVTKVWRYDGAAERPAVTMQLQQSVNGGDWADVNGAAATLTGDEQPTAWSHTWTNLPAYTDDGDAILYKAVERATLAGYNHDADTDVTANGVTTITNIQQIDVVVEKMWQDDHDRDGLRPKATEDDPAPAIEVTLTGKIAGATTAAVTEKLPMLVADGKVTFTGMSKYDVDGNLILYSAADVVESYETSSTETTDTNYTIQLTNAYEPQTVVIELEKVWQDADNQDQQRPAQITLTLSYPDQDADGNLLPDGKTVNVTLTAPATDPQANTWTYTSEGGTDVFYKFYNHGTQISYSVAEGDVPEGYQASGTGELNENYAATVTNDYTPGLTSVTGAKTWLDGGVEHNNQTELTLTLYRSYVQNNLPVREEVEGAVPTWDGNSYTFADLPVNLPGAQGVALTYDVVEADVEGYDSQRTEVPGGKVYNFTNTLLTEVTVTKRWVDDNTARPTSVTVELMNGTESVATSEGDWMVVNGNTWTYTFTDVPAYDASNNKITYAAHETHIGETPVAGGIAGAYHVSESGLTVVNTKHVSVSFTKHWVDGLAQTHPDVTFALIADGEPVADKTPTWDETDAQNWIATYTDLPVAKDVNGVVTPILYSVAETAIDGATVTNGMAAGYAVSYARNAAGAVTVVTNTKLIELVVTKTWTDENVVEATKTHPASVTVDVLQGNDLYTTLTLNANSNPAWTGYVVGMPQFPDGSATPYQYKVVETKIGDEPVAQEGKALGYAATVLNGDPNPTTGNYDVTVDNTRELVSFTAKKVWQGDYDAYRPDSVTVQLMNGNTPVGAAVTLAAGETAADGWTHTWQSLPKYDATGTPISYRVLETKIGELDVVNGGAHNYTVSYGDVLTIEGGNLSQTVTNTYDATNAYTTSKVWRDGLTTGHPSITLQLRQSNDAGASWANVGEQITDGVTTLTDGTTAKTWMRLPRYDADSNALAYRAIETTIGTTAVVDDEAEGYAVTYSDDLATITNTLYMSKPGAKKWVDGGVQHTAANTQIGLTLSRKVADGDWVVVSDEEYALNWNAAMTEYTFTGLRASTDDNLPYIYKVEETGVPEGYLNHTTNPDELLNVLATTHTVNKVWRDDGPEERPSVAMLLWQSVDGYNWMDCELDATLTGAESTPWSYVWTNLPAYTDDGDAILYKATEAEDSTPKGYTHDYRTDVTLDGTTTITNIKTGTVTVTKQWDDNNDLFLMRSVNSGLGGTGSDVYVRLFTVDANGVATATANTQALTTAQEAAYSFADVPLYDANGDPVRYTAYETSFTANDLLAPFAYTQETEPTYATVTADADRVAVTLTNTYAPDTYGDYTANKKWEGDEHYVADRPETATVRLQWLLDGERAWADVPATLATAIDGVSATVPVKDDGIKTWTGLPLYYSQKKVLGYQAAEIDTRDALANLGYAVAYAPNLNITGNHVTLITNTRQTTTVEGTKTWVEPTATTHDNAEDITILLYKGTGDNKTVATYAPAQLVWTDNAYVISGLPKAENGEDIVYSVEELINDTVTGTYRKEQTGNDFVNTLLTEAAIQKVWLDDGSAATVAARPDLKLTLYANYADGTSAALEIDTPTPDKNGNTWTYIYEDLPKADATHGAITYTAIEDATALAGTGYQPVNNAAPGANVLKNLMHTLVAGTKTFVDGSGTYLRPTQIVVQLQRKVGAGEWENSGDPQTVDVTYNSATYSYGASYAFPAGATSADNGLPAFTTDGTPIAYRVRETGLVYPGGETIAPEAAGYEVRYSDDSYDIENAAQTKNLVITKKWFTNEAATALPSEITVNVYRNSVADENLVVSGAYVLRNGTFEWTAMMDNLVRYDPLTGEEITYVVEENKFDGSDTYQTTVLGTTNAEVGGISTDTATIINTKLVDVSATKTWLDGAYNANIRPSTLTVQLWRYTQRNGIDAPSDAQKVGETVTIRPIAPSGSAWTQSFGPQLYADADGNRYNYFVTEVLPAPIGNLEYREVSQDKYDLALENRLYWTQITVNKVWNAPQSVIDLASVDIRLVQGENVYTPMKVTKNGATWTYAFQGELPAYPIDGTTPYTYKATEQSVTVGEVTQDVANGMVGTFQAPLDFDFSFAVTVEDTSNDSHTITNAMVRTIEGTKTWVDMDNYYGTRADEVTVALYEVDGTTPVQTVTTNATENWEYTFPNVDATKSYELRETQIGDAVVTYDPVYGNIARGYKAIVNGFNVTNELITTNVSLPKTWLDGSEVANDDRPVPTITVYRKLAGAQSADIMNPQPKAENVAWNKTVGANEWSVTASNLPAFDEKGEAYVYTINEETDGMDAYNVYFDDKGMVNTLKTSVIVNKVWADDNDRDGLRPADDDEIEVTLTGKAANSPDAPVVKTAMMKVSDGTVTFDGLPKYDSQNNRIIYTATDTVEGYEATAESNPDNSVLDITNTHEPPKTALTFRKLWDDANNQDGIRPESLTLTLTYQDQDENGALVDKTEEITLTPATTDPTNPGYNAWTYTSEETYFVNYNHGTAIDYKVDEAEGSVPEGYAPTGVGSMTDYASAVTNAHEVKLVNVTGTKTWRDGGLTHNTAAEVTLRLYRSYQTEAGVKTEEVADATPSWTGDTYAYTGLPAYLPGAQGVELSYDVAEDKIPNYVGENTRTVDEQTGDTVVNIANTLTRSIRVTKVWVDGDGTFRRGLAAPVIQLKDGDTVVRDVKVANMAVSRWSYTFTEVPAYDENGDAIRFSVGEERVPGNGRYRATYNDDTLTVTNTAYVTVYFHNVLGQVIQQTTVPLGGSAVAPGGPFVPGRVFQYWYGGVWQNVKQDQYLYPAYLDADDGTLIVDNPVPLAGGAIQNVGDCID